MKKFAQRAVEAAGRRLVCETLDKLAQPAVREEIIGHALALSGDEDVPDDVQRLASYIGAPLFDVVLERLGEAAALSIIEDLAPTIRLATPTTTVGAVSAVQRRKRAPLVGTGRRRVVVVDADEPSRAAVTDLLRRAGYSVVTAADGHVALAMCRRNTPDLIVAEVDLPTMGGVHLAWLLALSFGSGSPPVVLSTGSGKTVRRRSRNVVCVLDKTRLDDLVGAVDMLLVRGREWEGEPGG